MVDIIYLFDFTEGGERVPGTEKIWCIVCSRESGGDIQVKKESWGKHVKSSGHQAALTRSWNTEAQAASLNNEVVNAYQAVAMGLRAPELLPRPPRPQMEPENDYGHFSDMVDVCEVSDPEAVVQAQAQIDAANAKRLQDQFDLLLSKCIEDEYLESDDRDDTIPSTVHAVQLLREPFSSYCWFVLTVWEGLDKDDLEDDINNDTSDADYILYGSKTVSLYTYFHMSHY
jgi:hypothetical protein